MIPRNLVHSVSKATFTACLSDAQRLSAAVRNATTPADKLFATEYYLSDDGLSGFALSADGSGDSDLRGVFSLVKGRGDRLVSEAVFYGANTLDCFDGYLPTLYAKHGFVESVRQPNWTEGGPDVVYMTHVSALIPLEA